MGDRPKALTADQVALAERMRASGEPVPVIAETLGVSQGDAVPDTGREGLTPQPDYRAPSVPL